MRVILFFFHSFRLLFAIFFIANTMDLFFFITICYLKITVVIAGKLKLSK